MDPGALATHLIVAADEARYRDPRRALERAVAARTFAASLEHSDLVTEQDSPGPRFRWIALQSDAWAVLGSAQRSVGEIEEAEASLLVALTFLDALPAPENSETRTRRARLAQRAGYVRMDQGRFDEALDLLAQSRLIYLDLGLEQRAATAKVDGALVLMRSGRRREAVTQLAAALEVLDRETEPRSYLAAVHNMARTLLEIAESPAEEKEAIGWLELARREHGRYPEALNILRLRAVAALTAARFGRLEAAILELDRLAGELAAIGAVADQVLALLHLVELSLRHPGTDGHAALRVVGRLFPLLRRLPVDGEAKAALRRLLARAERRELTGDAVRRAVDLIERSLRSRSL